jgi:DHA3 family multidrug efflux protein-like MFS transporter
MLFMAIFGLFFGTLVDRYKKKRVMLASSAITLGAYLAAGLVYLLLPKESLSDWASGAFWFFGSIILIGATVENLRNIALSTTVTLLVPKENHDKANGLVGSVQGVAFVVTSVFSGLSIGLLGMGWTLLLAILLTAVALIHLLFVPIPEKDILHDPALADKKIDFKGSIAAIRAVPGLLALIFFAAFNNFISGVFIALVDPYGLTLFSVETWGLVLGFATSGFVIGGLVVSKKGLGKNPLRTLLLVNVGIAILDMSFTSREVWPLFVIGIFLFMCLIPIVEAAEQTVIQRVVPYKRQGRVFGFAQSIEAGAAPLTAFLIGPIAQFWVIPYVQTNGDKPILDILLGQGHARGIALIFLVSGFILLVATLLAFTTKSYRILTAYYAKS